MRLAILRAIECYTASRTDLTTECSYHTREEQTILVREREERDGAGEGEGRDDEAAARMLVTTADWDILGKGKVSPAGKLSLLSI